MTNHLARACVYFEFYPSGDKMYTGNFALRRRHQPLVCFGPDVTYLSPAS